MVKGTHLTLIHGGKPPFEKHSPQFCEGLATNTRLMGVVALKAVELMPDGSRVVHFFHLDFEEYGIDAYEKVVGEDVETMERMTRKMTGGLGGELVPLNPEELVWLLREAYAVNRLNDEPIPEAMGSAFHFLKAETALDFQGVKGLWGKITPAMETDVELINYYIMRLWAADKEGSSFLSRGGSHFASLSATSGVMVRNATKKLREAGGIRYYLSESLCDNESEYRIAACELGVFEEDGLRRIFSVAVQSTFKVSEVEAAFMLRRPEYISVYKAPDTDRIRLFFDLFKPDAMITVHENGLLYTYFKPDNNHVREASYQLNDDVKAYYYLSEDEELVVCSLSEKHLREAQIELELKAVMPLLQFEGEYHSEIPVLYDFINSDYMHFSDFWEDYH